MQFKKNIHEEAMKSKFKGISKTLDDILNRKRPSNDKYGLGYKTNYYSFTNQSGNKKIYDAALKILVKKEERKKSIPNSHEKNKINVIPKKPMTNRYQHIFLGHCYSCNNVGHKAINCRAYGKFHEYKKNSPSDKPKGRNYYRFTLLQKYDLECYKCNNHGHMARDCKPMTPTRRLLQICFKTKNKRRIGRNRMKRRVP